MNNPSIPKEYGRVWAEIDLSAIRENLCALKKNLKPGTKILVVLKNDGYHHGATEIASYLNDSVDWIGVATVEEGILLRKNNIETPILILGPVFPERFTELIENHICPTIFTEEDAITFSEEAKKLSAVGRFHIAVDSGMSRIGLPMTEESADILTKMLNLPSVSCDGIFTHLATMDQKDPSFALLQVQKFRDFIEVCRKKHQDLPVIHVANSAATILKEGFSYPMVRIGIALYGIFPSEEMEQNKVVLHPAMELKSRISYIKDIPEGTSISYGCTFISDRPMRIATIPIGYADGIPRELSNKGFVLIRGKRAKICGRICMDQLMVDITDIPDVTHGEIVTILGSDGDDTISAYEISRLSGRIPYEFFSGVSARVPRIFKVNGEKVSENDSFYTLKKPIKP